MTGAKKLFLTVSAIMLAVSSTSVSFAEEDKPYGNLNLTFSSQYIWRGNELSKNSLVIFPSSTVGFKGLEMNFWMFFDTDYYSYDEDRSATTPGNGSDTLHETDLMISYSNNINRLNYMLGGIYYDSDSTEDVGGTSNQEVFAILGLDILLLPEISVWREIEINNDSWYCTGSLSHNLDLSDYYSLSFGAWASFLSFTGDIEIAGVQTREYEQWHDGNAWIALDIFLNDYVILTPHAYYTWSISSEAEDYIASLSFNGKTHWWVYGGLTVDVSF